VPTLIATLLHPAGRDLVLSITNTEINQAMLVLVILAAIPLLAFTYTQVGLQTGAIEMGTHGHHSDAAKSPEKIHQEHIDFGHFALMAALGLTIVGTGLLASLQQPGWLITAWLTGITVIYYGVASIAFPEAASTVNVIWSIGAIVWGLAFIGIATITNNLDRPIAYGGKTPTKTPEK
ncbi:MAG: hypothetical protein ABEI86_13180, partial [Halobacteriaceae archaeon]